MGRDDSIAKATCTGEGVKYILECVTCRKGGIKRRYYRESARSGYQRGVDHMREIREGVIAHPMVSHFWEEHNSRRQEILMKITSTHLTPLEHQVQESCNIIKAMTNEEECLNRKSEGGGREYWEL